MPLTEQQISDRRQGIGASDMAAVLGVDPWSQPIDVYYEKVHGYSRDLSDSEPVYWGNAFEEAVAKAYAERTGHKVRNMKTRVHTEYPWLRVNLDRKVEGKRKCLEIKNVGARVAHLWGDAYTSDIAPYYAPQVHQQLLVCDYEEADVAVVIGGQDFRIYTVYRDERWDNLIISVADKFWNEHVVPREQPPVNFEHARIKALMKRLWPTVDADAIIDLSPAQIAWHDVLVEAQERHRHYERVIDGAKAHLQMEMGNAMVAMLPDGRGYRRKVIKKTAYTVEPVSYVDFRLVNKPPQAKIEIIKEPENGTGNSSDAE